MRVEERYVSDRDAIAITSMARVGRRIYLGLTGGSRILSVCDVDTGRIEMLDEIFPWVTGRGYCAKLHNFVLFRHGSRCERGLCLTPPPCPAP